MATVRVTATATKPFNSESLSFFPLQQHMVYNYLEVCSYDDIRYKDAISIFKIVAICVQANSCNNSTHIILGKILERTCGSHRTGFRGQAGGSELYDERSTGLDRSIDRSIHLKIFVT